ncbi:hypothetical protein JD844_009377 [Phrynosoma platyrhinos]|uniref:Uncharacterized protein n=1 Tax=Phrynosoma platyrhinos TaxID=52577 RepID=A0ABQ7TG04_PHRPL|nr:hypothetical protein JD844_009377 [Phrynosoma platyrhinos]
MITKVWLLDICLIVLLFTETLSQNCSHLRKNLLEDNKENLGVMRNQMGSVFPLQCLNDIISFSSQPEEENLQNIFELQKQNATVALHEILQQILCIFSQNHTKLSWDESSIGIFKIGLNQEIAKLKPCLGEDEDEEDVRESVKTYFKRIKDFLKEGEYSQCAWEVVQIEVSRFFVVMGQLIRRLQTKDTVSAPEADETETETHTSPCLLPGIFGFAQGCSRLRGKLHETNQDNLELLSTRMGSSIPRECISEVIGFSSSLDENRLPSINEFKPENATVAIDEILQQIIYTLSQKHDDLAWDDKSIAVFKLGLAQEIVTLGPSPVPIPMKDDAETQAHVIFQEHQIYLPVIDSHRTAE